MRSVEWARSCQLRSSPGRIYHSGPSKPVRLLVGVVAFGEPDVLSFESHESVEQILQYHGLLGLQR